MFIRIKERERRKEGGSRGRRWRFRNRFLEKHGYVFARVQRHAKTDEGDEEIRERRRGWFGGGKGGFFFGRGANGGRARGREVREEVDEDFGQRRYRRRGRRRGKAPTPIIEEEAIVVFGSEKQQPQQRFWGRGPSTSKQEFFRVQGKVSLGRRRRGVRGERDGKRRATIRLFLLLFFFFFFFFF